MLSGDLRSFGLIDILGVIKKDRKSCILSVENADGSYIVVYFKDGNPLLIRSVAKSFMIYLDMDFDSILKKEGINRKNLTDILIERLPKLLSLKAGRFSVSTGFIRFPQDIESSVETENLVMSLSRTLSKEEIDRKISDEGLVFEKSPDSEAQLKNLSLTDIEIDVLDLVDGNKTVSEIENKIVLQEILKKAGSFSEEDREKTKLEIKRALYGFLTAGIIQQKLKFKKPENVFDRIINLLELRYQKKSGV